MSAMNEALQDWEVDFFWRRAQDRWEWEQDHSPEVDLVRAETERILASDARYAFPHHVGVVSYAMMTEDQLRRFMQGGDL